MSVIAIANTKGGSGKTTFVAILAGELVAARAKVVVIEGDSNRPLATWASRSGTPLIDATETRISDTASGLAELQRVAGNSRLVVITTKDDDELLMQWLEVATAWAQFVITDPEGSANLWMITAISQADLVITPFAPTALDAHQVIETVRAVAGWSKKTRNKVPHKLLITRSNPGAVITRDEREIREDLVKSGMPLMLNSIQDRPAFRALFKYNVTLDALHPTDHRISGLDQARTNAAAVTAEIVNFLNDQSQSRIAQ